MKILVIADEESRSLWDFYSPEKLRGADLIISCGDLNPDYLEFLVTLSGRQLLYIRGNHDSVYDRKPPEGCICIEDKIYNYEGLRIAGLGGSMKYKESSDMYTEAQMRSRVRKLKSKISFTNGIDILVTHAPCAGYGDLADLPHRGFECFNQLLDSAKPLYMLHGHVHMTYGREVKRTRSHPSGTVIINAFESFLLEIPETDYPAFGNTGSALYDAICRNGAKHSMFRYNPI